MYKTKESISTRNALTRPICDWTCSALTRLFLIVRSIYSENAWRSRTFFADTRYTACEPNLVVRGHWPKLIAKYRVIPGTSSYKLAVVHQEVIALWLHTTAISQICVKRTQGAQMWRFLRLGPEIRHSAAIHHRKLVHISDALHLWSKSAHVILSLAIPNLSISNELLLLLSSVNDVVFHFSFTHFPLGKEALSNLFPEL